MSSILRHIVAWIFFSIVITVAVLTITFVSFPLENWSFLFDRTLFDLPFLLIVLLIPILIGTVVGLSTGWNLRQRFLWIHRQLDAILKDQKISTSEDHSKELNRIEEKVIELQEKVSKQTEQAQQLATERAVDREKSLQEVVIQERNRLARELHDSVSQQLFAASMLMSAINEANPLEDTGIKKQLSLVENMIHQSQLEMRALLLHLRPVALKGKSLYEGMEELLVELTQKVPMEIDWKLEQFSAAKGIEDQLFRILQESISNTLRHAKATTLHVMLIERDHMIILRVVDNGIGFNIENARTSSYGLENMKERSNEIGGTFKVISLPEQGTRIEVKVPLIKREDEKRD